MGHSIQEVRAVVVIGTSIYGVLLIDGYLGPPYSRESMVYNGMQCRHKYSGAVVISIRIPQESYLSVYNWYSQHKKPVSIIRNHLYRER